MAAKGTIVAPGSRSGGAHDATGSMPGRGSKSSVLLNWIRVDRHSETPIYRQIADQIREALLTGRLEAGELLPASRALAGDLQVSRITTMQSYDQLAAEGFIVSRQGSGTRVAAALAQKPLVRSDPARHPFGSRPIEDLFHPPEGVEFQPGIPAFDAFPRLRWSRLLQRQGASNDPFLLDYAHAGGYPPLREELARYLGGSRGVDCRPDQVIIVTSTRAAVAVACTVLWPDPGIVAVENPGYKTVQRVLLAAGHGLRHVPVDLQGMRVDELVGEAGRCLGAYVSAAHQWPTGSTLSAERRITLLNWAASSDAWVLEDDYDSEFRFDSPPVATLHSFGSGRVVYLGTFSKTLAPSIRTAYLVVPPGAVRESERAAFQMGVEPPLHVQAALADFLADGDFARHILRMRKLYTHRRALLARALSTSFGDRVDVHCPPGGLQIIARFRTSAPDVEIADLAARAGIVIRPMSNWESGPPALNALQLGFAAVPERRIEPGIARLRNALADLV